MSRKLLFKRFLLASVVYYFAIQAYVFYNTAYGAKHVVTEQAINVSSLSAVAQTKRRNIIEGLLRLYKAEDLEPGNRLWRNFDRKAVFEEPSMKLPGVTKVMDMFDFMRRIVQQCKATVKAETHYEYKVKVELDFEFSVAFFGSRILNMATWLEFGGKGKHLKVVHVVEEWNQVELISSENTMFPVGWSVERIRSVHGMLVAILCANY